MRGQAPYPVRLDPREAVFLAGNGIDLDPFKFGRYALRRTKALLSYRRKGDLRAQSSSWQSHDILPANIR